MRQFADNFFTFAVGTYLITSAQLGTDIPTALYWLFVILVVLASVLSTVTFGGFGVFFATVPQHVDVFGPGGEQNDFAMATFTEAAKAVETYRTPSIFALSFTGSLVLMAGLLMQGWHIILAFEVIGSAVGYGFIHSFKTNLPTIREQIYGATE